MAVADPEVATSGPTTLQLLGTVVLHKAHRVATVVILDNNEKKEIRTNPWFHTQETMQGLNCGCDFRLLWFGFQTCSSVA